VTAQGARSAPSGEVAVTIACACNGCSCATADDCPPFQACDTDAGICDDYCQGAGCECNADSQCASEYSISYGGLGQGEICVSGVCAPGCNAATDCAVDSACDLTNHTCACSGPGCACVIDTQCNQDDEQREIDCGTDGLCTTGCKSGYDCVANAACDLSQGFIGTCVASCSSGLCGCIFNSQCTGGDAGLGIACLAQTGLCGPGCATGDDCPSNAACDTDVNACDAGCGTASNYYRCACTSDTQCNGGMTGQGVVCYSGLCFDGCNSGADCPSGTCDVDGGTTVGTCL
jgi:hypothetical protein